MTGFTSRKSPRLIYGQGTSEGLGGIAREFGGQRVLLVTDPGIAKAGHADRAGKSLREAGCEVTVFDGVVENPTTREVYACVETARAANVDLIVGLGGGSSMDTAKGCNFVLTSGGRMEDYWGHDKATAPMLPFIAVPTTAGTGSECQSYALITRQDTHEKMACGDARALAVAAILDPLLTETQPAFVAACTGVDALSHALEAAVTKRRNPLSLLYARESFRLIEANLETVLTTPENHEARGAMLLGAALAGMAIENSMLGAAHSAANPLTAYFDTVHGIAVGLMLPHVMRYNAHEPAARETYAELARQARLAGPETPLDEAAARLVRRTEKLLATAGLPASLDASGADAARIPELAAMAARQWTAQFNPRPIAEPEFASLYETAFTAVPA